jgi:anaerobic selenocysteine-containing dehydrogenase
MTQVKTSCRCCSAACGIVVETRGDDIVKVRGDPDDTRSGGYLCPKGASLPYFHHHPQRLRQPQLFGSDADWTRCLDDLARRIAAAVAAQGPDSIGFYQGTGAVMDSLGVAMLARFIERLGSSQFYCAATVDVAPAMRAAELVSGSWELHPVWLPEDEHSRLALYLGSNPLVSHGYLSIMPDPQHRIRRFQQRGGQLWVVDPQRTKTAALADRHLAIRPGTDAILLAWLVRELLAAKAPAADFERLTSAADRAGLRAAVAPFTLDFAAPAVGIEPADLLALRDQIIAAGRLAVVSGTGITFGPDALVTEWLRWVLLIVTGSLDRPGGMWFNPGWLAALEQREWLPPGPAGKLGPGPRSRPELHRLLDQNPCVALADEIESGQLRVLLVAGGSPLTAFPEPARTAAALMKLDALAVIDLVQTPLLPLASHVLAVAGQLERADILVETRTLYAPSVVKPIGECKPTWWILAQLGRRLGFDILDGLDPDRATDELLLQRLAAGGRDGPAALFAAGPQGLEPPHLYGWVSAKALPEGRWRLLPPALPQRLAAWLNARPQRRPLQWVNSRQLTKTNTTRYLPPGKSRELPQLRIHPEDAAAFGIIDGDRVRLDSDAGHLHADARLDGNLRPGVVALPHSWWDTNVCQLTSARETVDPLTGQPQMTALAVSLQRVGAAADAGIPRHDLRASS